MRHRAFVGGWAFGLIAVGLVGCDSGPEFAEVEGTVTRNGKPLDKIQVEFHPSGAGPRSVAVTDAAGKYVLKSDDGTRSGAVVGPHRVVLRDVGMMPDKAPPRSELNTDFAKGKPIRITPEYGDVVKTPVKKTVTAGNKNVVDIEVK